MKRLLLIIIILIGITKTKAQTYVSGGIYSNTTWTKAASPYIVTDHVVVFPDVTLTIEPGVMIKFDSSKYLEVRHAKINAVGLASDPIIFTSNSTSPKPISWRGIHITNNVADTTRFSYCNFQFALYALTKSDSSYITGKLIVKNCNFSEIGEIGLSSDGTCILDSSTFKNCKNGFSNEGRTLIANNCTFKKCTIGIKSYGSSYNSRIKNCIIDSNKTGIQNLHGTVDSTLITNNENGFYNQQGHIIIKNCTITNNSIYGIYSGYGDSILNCDISNNGIGIAASMSFVSKNQITYNKKGILIVRYNYYATNMFVVCNKICNNLDYEISSEQLPVTTLNYPNNYWCTPDSASTRPKILDGYKDVKLPIINYMPLDTLNCYGPVVTRIKENKTNETINIKLYPNPFSQTATLEFENPQNKSHQLNVFNTIGQLVLSIENIKSNQVLIERKELQSGLYFYQLRNEEGVIGTGKMMIE